MDQFQEEYIRQEQLHRRRVKAVRRMLLVLLLALWELCTRLNIIDGFIFSSPSRVLFCLAGMIRDGSILRKTITPVVTGTDDEKEGKAEAYAEGESTVIAMARLRLTEECGLQCGNCNEAGCTCVGCNDNINK